ncbi:MAG: TIM barrel protein [Verrucomicrobia bacterium]|nr:TIM barrel protein [Verrucomicrobiota bacterium]MDA1066398.1 TIM barrel protein [Verrucomicrobiota bacterium]
MSSRLIQNVFFLCFCLLMTACAPKQSAKDVATAENFAKENILAWAFTNFDIERSAEERAQLLRRVGFKKAGYIVSNANAKDAFDAHVLAYKKYDISIISVWWQSSNEDLMEDPKTRMVLVGLDKHNLKPDIWFSLGKDLVEAIPEDQRLDRAVAILRPLAIEARRRGVRFALYNHMEWFGETDNQIAIIERLRSEGNMDHVGMVYNMHHGHDRIDNFKTVFQKMQPYLFAFNLNGMRVEGPKIILIGEGDREQAMIKTVIDSGFKGPIGILHHFAKQDAEPVYVANLKGLKSILEALGHEEVAATY